MLLSTYIGLIVRPVHTIQQIVDDRPLGLGLLTLLIVAIANGIVTFGLGIDTATFEEFADEEIDIGIGFIVIGALLFVAFVAIELGFFSVIVHLISKLFGGDGAYTGMLAGLMMLSILSLIPLVPSLLDVLATGIGEAAEGETSPFEAISAIVSLVVFIWTIILGIILIRENYPLTTGMAALSGIASFFAALVVGVILFILLIIVLIAIVLGLGIATG
ncbi:MAG: hypothetical protein F4X20_00245 [Dehalococcoidia bacterium]|nr:hypothetical protein [Dehalococcoidia bacterium]